MSRVVPEGDDEPEASISRKRVMEPPAPFLLLRDLKGICFLENEIQTDHGRIGSGSQGEVRKVEIDILGVCALKKLAITRGRFGKGCASILDDELAYHRALVENTLDWELQLKNDTEREMQFSKEVAHHPNIVGFFGYLQREVNGHKLYYGLVMEYMEGGTIADMMKNDQTSPFYLTESRIVSYSLDIARALAACHTKYYIMHRDVKPSNVLLTGDRKTAKLSDFGYAKKAKDTNNTNKKGTLTYMAPELINETLSNTSPYAFKPDVWSFSMLVYAMTFKRDPFTEDELKSTQRHRDRLLLEGERPSTDGWPMQQEGFRAGILNVISKGWASNPDLRRDMIDTVTKLREMSARIQTSGENM